MKILHIATAVHKAGGGTSEVIPRICEALVEAGCQVRLISGKVEQLADSAIRAQARGVEMRFAKIRCLPHVGFLRLTSEFRREIEEGVSWCDIVHIHGHWQDVPWFAPCVARRLGKPYIMQPHGFLEPERLKKSAVRKKIIGALFERSNLNRAVAVIATAESEKMGIQQFGVRAPIEVISLGLDTERIEAAHRDEVLLNRLGLSPNKKTLLYFSRLTPIKGLDLLAEAWERLNDYHRTWQLCIAGPDDRGYAAQIKKVYDRLITDDSVCFTGPVYGDDKYNLLRSVEAFVLPTRSENWSVAVQEALAAGLPTVCTKGAPWEVINEYKAGFWVDVGVEPIEAALCEIMSLSDNQRTAMGIRGRQLVADKYTWSPIAEQTLRLYERVMI